MIPASEYIRRERGDATSVKAEITQAGREKFFRRLRWEGKQIRVPCLLDRHIYGSLPFD